MIDQRPKRPGTASLPQRPSHSAVTLRLLALLALLCLGLMACGKGGGSGDRDCKASCKAMNENMPGHEWVAAYADGSGFKAFEACISELAKRNEFDDQGQCTARGLAACTGACERAKLRARALSSDP